MLYKGRRLTERVRGRCAGRNTRAMWREASLCMGNESRRGSVISNCDPDKLMSRFLSFTTVHAFTRTNPHRHQPSAAANEGGISQDLVRACQGLASSGNLNMWKGSRARSTFKFSTDVLSFNLLKCGLCSPLRILSLYENCWSG